jgi:Xaa-Pro aminopeptidase
MVYTKRRQELAKRLPSRAIAVIPGAQEMIRNGDAHYRFRQDSDFYYLTGYDEPNALLVVMAGEAGESIVFNRKRVPSEELWTGPRLGQEGAISELQVTAAYPIEMFSNMLPELLLEKEAIYFPFSRAPAYEKMILEAWSKVKGNARQGKIVPDTLREIAPLIGEMRLFKDEHEIALMREAARISTAGHLRVMQRCTALRTEYELEAEFLYEVMRQGCRGLAYDSIVASGENACVLHYTANHDMLSRDQLVLIDAGGEYRYYASDITRTIPANGRFNGEQRAIYELVLSAQRAGINLVKPGVLWPHIQEVMVRVLTEGLIDLNLLKGSVDSLIEQQEYKRFYMHSSGHWLGLDVHDAGAYKKSEVWRTLEPGMVLTVEPGLYLSRQVMPEGAIGCGIGVRIEDDILVTEHGHENLTQGLPVKISEIEDVMRD